jgi:heme/copper-type cytochrome/quinol oxidase subunit 2
MLEAELKQYVLQPMVDLVMAQLYPYIYIITFFVFFIFLSIFAILFVLMSLMRASRRD